MAVSRLVGVVVPVACCLSLLLHATALWREPVRVDEFEHLHAAWLVQQGSRPFVDFFEHHTPLFYYLAPHFLPSSGADYDTVLAMRWLALVFTAMMTAAGWLWLRRFGLVHGWLAAGMVACNATILTFGHVLFQDTFAAPLLVASAALFGGGAGKPRWMFGSGLCFGLAVMFNLKASMAVFAPLALAAGRLWTARTGAAGVRSWVADSAAYLAGGLASVVFVAALLGREVSLGMWQYAFLMNMGWKARHSGWASLKGAALADELVSIAALVFILARLATLRRRGFELGERDAPWLFLVSMTAGVFLLPVVWEEYFVALTPFLALTGALALGDWFAGWEGGSAAGRYSRFALVLLGLAALVPIRSFPAAADAGHILARSGLILLLSAAVALVAWRTAPAPMRWPVALCLALVTVVPLVRTAASLYRVNNRAQRAAVEYLMANTGPNDAVFDGYTGYGVFRPHAYFYWFLHEEIQAMLPERDKAERLIEALEAKRPAIAISDKWMATLPAPVRAYLARHYEPAPYAGLLRRKPEDATPRPQVPPAPAR